MFKKLIALTLIASLTTACADNKVLSFHDGKKEVVTYGLMDAGSERLDCVNYSLAYGNIVWSVILIGSILIPVYMIGFSLYEPDSVDVSCDYKKSNS